MWLSGASTDPDVVLRSGSFVDLTGAGTVAVLATCGNSPMFPAASAPRGGARPVPVEVRRRRGSDLTLAPPQKPSASGSPGSPARAGDRGCLLRRGADRHGRRPRQRHRSATAWTPRSAPLRYGTSPVAGSAHRTRARKRLDRLLRAAYSPVTPLGHPTPAEPGEAGVWTFNLTARPRVPRRTRRDRHVGADELHPS